MLTRCGCKPQIYASYMDAQLTNSPARGSVITITCTLQSRYMYVPGFQVFLILLICMHKSFTQYDIKQMPFLCPPHFRFVPK